MNQTKLPKPQAIDVVPASDVSALIEATDRAFVQLERELEIARSEAEQLESLAAAEGIDPAASTWTMVRLQRFLEDLRDEARRDAAATVDVAQQRVRLDMDEAASMVGFGDASTPRFAWAADVASSRPPQPLEPLQPRRTPNQPPGAVTSAARFATEPALVPTPPAAGPVTTAAVSAPPPVVAVANGNSFAPPNETIAFGSVVSTPDAAPATMHSSATLTPLAPMPAPVDDGNDTDDEWWNGDGASAQTTAAANPAEASLAAVSVPVPIKPWPKPQPT